MEEEELYYIDENGDKRCSACGCIVGECDKEECCCNMCSGKGVTND